MSKNLSPAVTLTREQKEQRRLAAAQELLEGEKTQTQIAEDHGVTLGGSFPMEVNTRRRGNRGAEKHHSMIRTAVTLWRGRRTVPVA
jgi:hypothetical protein